MKENIQKAIIDMVGQIDEEKYLKYIYVLIKEMLDHK